MKKRLKFVENNSADENNSKSVSSKQQNIPKMTLSRVDDFPIEER